MASPTLRSYLALTRPNSQLEVMYKSPYLALTRIISHKLAQSRHCQVDTILISHPTLSVISQLLHKGKTAKNTDFKSLKDNVIGPSHLLEFPIASVARVFHHFTFDEFFLA